MRCVQSPLRPHPSRTLRMANPDFSGCFSHQSNTNSESLPGIRKATKELFSNLRFFSSRPSDAVQGTGRHTCGNRCVPRSLACRHSSTRCHATTLVISRSTSSESTNALGHRESVPMVRLRIPTPRVTHQALHR